MRIGNVEINGRAVLAPMAGVADRAFRELCREYGAACVVGEMASAKGICMGDKKSAGLLLLGESERPAAVQLFGCDPAAMARAAQKAMQYSPDIIDINMGCPAPKIASGGGGAALMRNPGLAREIVTAVVGAAGVPVTVKLRAGWDAENINAVHMARLAEEAGASGVTVHGRTRAQMYAPPVDLEIIRLVKSAVSIPVTGNGDVFSGEDAARMLEYTGCDAVMVGRGALGSPWVFAEIAAYLNHGRVLPPPPVSERMRVMVRHIERICAYKGERTGMREARKHAAWYIKGFRGAASLRAKACGLETMEQLRELALEACGGPYDMT